MKHRSRRERIAPQLADLKMPGALEALDGILSGVDGGAPTAGETIERILAAQIAPPSLSDDPTMPESSNLRACNPAKNPSPLPTRGCAIFDAHVCAVLHARQHPRNEAVQSALPPNRFLTR